MKKTHNFCKRVVIFCISFIVLYIIASIAFNFLFQIELSPTLTTCVFGFFGTELGACAFVRIMQGKYEQVELPKQEVAPDVTPPDVTPPPVVNNQIIESTENYDEDNGITAQELIDRLSKY